jgi:hypothetical protein
MKVASKVLTTPDKYSLSLELDRKELLAMMVICAKMRDFNGDYSIGVRKLAQLIEAELELTFKDALPTFAAKYLGNHEDD